MIKQCELCKQKFETPKTNPNKKFCSNECVQKNKSIFQKKYQNSEEGRRKNSEAQKIAQNRPDVKEKQQKERKERANRPDVKEKFQKWSKEFHNLDEQKKKTSKWTKNYFNTVDGAREKISNNIKRYYINIYPFDDKAKINKSEAAKKCWTNIEYREKITNATCNRWESDLDSFRPKSSYKNFILPSGKIIRVQGYEDKAISNLLLLYSELDIYIKNKEIYLQVGKILYEYNGNTHRYFPDIYIKSINTIIEVKSVWTYEQQKERNLMKEKACLKQGYNFEFIIL